VGEEAGEVGEAVDLHEQVGQLDLRQPLRDPPPEILGSTGQVFGGIAGEEELTLLHLDRGAAQGGDPEAPHDRAHLLPAGVQGRHAVRRDARLEADIFAELRPAVLGDEEVLEVGVAPGALDPSVAGLEGSSELPEQAQLPVPAPYPAVLGYDVQSPFGRN
jgi:hypothetical protein